MTPVTRCSRCRRPIKSGRSIGRTCQVRERAEKRKAALESVLRIATAPYSGRQIEAATSLIAAGKLRRSGKDGMWAAGSSDGVTVYRCCALYCPCMAKGPCKHMAAVAMVEAYEAFGGVA